MFATIECAQIYNSVPQLIITDSHSGCSSSRAANSVRVMCDSINDGASAPDYASASALAPVEDEMISLSLDNFISDIYNIVHNIVFNKYSTYIALQHIQQCT